MPLESNEKKNSKSSSAASLRQILKYVDKVDLFYILFGLFGSVLASFNWPILTITFGKMVDVFVRYEYWFNNNSTNTELETKRNIFMNDVKLLSGATGIVCITFIIGNLILFYSFQIFSLRLMKNVKHLYFHSILKQEIAWFDRQNSGEFASRISSDFKKFENGFNENLGLLLYNGSSSLVHLVLGFYYGWKLSLAILSIAPLMMFSAIVLTKLQTYYTQKELKAYSLASASTEEAITAIRTVFAFSGQQKEIERYESKLKIGMKYGFKRNFVTGLSVAIHWSLIYLALSLGIWYGVSLILNPLENYNIGTVVIIFWGITGCGFSFGYAAPFYESFQISRTAAKSIFNVIERESSIDSFKNIGKKLQDFKANIEFHNVYFNYPIRPNVPILQGFDLKINSGEIVALVGPSGCGKSTTIQLLQRFYDIDKGDIFLDNYNLKDLNVGWLREQLGVVGQEPILFDATIEENIRLGMPLEQMRQIKQEDIEKAAKEANAHDFISKLPNGYQTYVGDRGTQLSGGQKQRIAIARALISKPKILLLDEATSALDLESEHIVQSALDRASQNCTTIIIAHRLSTIINADRIIYIEKGQVMEEGTHKTLMEQKGRYYNLVQAQQIQTVNDVNNKTLHKFTLSKNESKQQNDFHHYPRRTSTRRSITGTFSNESSSDISNVALKLNSFQSGETIQIDNDEFKKLKKFPYIRLWKLIWLDKFYFLIAFITALAYGTSTPLYALIFGDFVDIFALSEDEEFLKKQTLIYAFAFIGLSIGIFICCTIQITLFGIVGEKLTKRLRMKAYSAILHQEISFFDEQSNNSGALCARLADDAANVQGVTGLRISMMCQAISTVVCALAMGFHYNWRLSLVSLTIMPIVAFASMVSSSAYSQQSSKDSETVEKASKNIIEVMNAIRTVVSLHKEQYFYNTFSQTIMEHYRSVRVKFFLKSLMMGLALGAPFFGYSINFFYGGYLISYGLLKSGDFFKIIESIIFGALVVGQSAVLSSGFTKAKLAALNIFNLIDRHPINELNNNSNNGTNYEGKLTTNRLDRSKGDVSFRGIYFSYPSRPDSSILNGLSFSAHQGETVALVGSSGCGKSTAIQLLERFYDCNSGKVYLDGQNIAELNVDWLRSQMALVSQEPILFSYSIHDNIAYGDHSRNVSRSEVEKAAKMANVHDFIKQLPLGYDTPVGSKGTQLSGGQKQRIAIARALVRDPAILLLDEATSALDTESEQIVQTALDEASKDRTCLVIAHRLKTIVNSDKIVVIHKGQNVEEGTHEELLARHGYYWQLYNNFQN